MQGPEFFKPVNEKYTLEQFRREHKLKEDGTTNKWKFQTDSPADWYSRLYYYGNNIEDPNQITDEQINRIFEVLDLIGKELGEIANVKNFICGKLYQSIKSVLRYEDVQAELEVSNNSYRRCVWDAIAIMERVYGDLIGGEVDTLIENPIRPFSDGQNLDLQQRLNQALLDHEKAENELALCIVESHRNANKMLDDMLAEHEKKIKEVLSSNGLNREKAEQYLSSLRERREQLGVIPDAVEIRLQARQGRAQELVEQNVESLNKRLNDALRTLQDSHKFNASQARIEQQLRQTISDFQVQLRAQRQLVTESQQTVLNLQNEISALKNQITTLNEEVADLTNTLRLNAEEHGKVKINLLNKIKSLESQNLENENSEELKRQLVAAQKELTELKKEYGTATAKKLDELETLQLLNQELEKRLQAQGDLSPIVEQHEKTIRELQANIESLVQRPPVNISGDDNVIKHFTNLLQEQENNHKAELSNYEANYLTITTEITVHHDALDRQLVELQAKIAVLMDKLPQDQQSLQALSLEVEKLQAELQGKAGNEQSAFTHIQKIQQALELKTAELERLTHQHNDLMRSAINERNQIQAENNRLQTQLTSAQQRANCLTQELTQVKEQSSVQFMQLQNQLIQAKNWADDLQAKVETNKQTIIELQKQIETLTVQAQATQSSSHELKGINLDLQKQIHDLQDLRTKQEQLNAELVQKIAGHETTIEKLQTELREIRTANEQKVSRLAEEKQQLETAKADADFLVKQQQDQIAQISEKLKTQQDINQQLTVDLETKKESLLGLEKSRLDLQQQFDTLVQEQKRAGEQGHTLASQLNEAFDAKSQLEQTLATVKQKLQDADKAKLELSEKVKLLESQNAKVSQSNEQLQSVLEQEKQKLAVLENSQVELQHQLGALDKDRQAAENKVAELAVKLEEANSQIANLSSVKTSSKQENLEGIIAELEAQVNALVGDANGKSLADELAEAVSLQDDLGDELSLQDDLGDELSLQNRLNTLKTKLEQVDMSASKNLASQVETLRAEVNLQVEARNKQETVINDLQKQLAAASKKDNALEIEALQEELQKSRKEAEELHARWLTATQKKGPSQVQGVVQSSHDQSREKELQRQLKEQKKLFNGMKRERDTIELQLTEKVNSYGNKDFELKKKSEQLEKKSGELSTLQQEHDQLFQLWTEKDEALRKALKAQQDAEEKTKDIQAVAYGQIIEKDKELERLKALVEKLQAKSGTQEEDG